MMGVTTNSRSSRRVPATLLDSSPEVAVTETAEGDDQLRIAGTALHGGLNQNAWGLSEQGAQAIADSLVERDLTASHPPLRGERYDRAIYGGQGAPVGTVRSADVVAADGMLDGGEYTVEYVAEVLDPEFAEKYEAGLYDADEYGVSVGIYADPESATCSACGERMVSDACSHDRFEEVDGEIAGPIYDDGESDHLAAVYLPAYEHADAEVAALQGALADPFPVVDADDGTDADVDADADVEQAGEIVADATTAPREYPVRVTDTPVHATRRVSLSRTDSPRLRIDTGRRTTQSD